MSLARRIPRSAGLIFMGWILFVSSWFAGSSPSLHAYLAPAMTMGGHASPRLRGVNGMGHNPHPDTRHSNANVIALNHTQAIANAAPRVAPHHNSGMSTHTDPWMQPNQKSWRLIILFQHNLPILLQAVAGYRRASTLMAPNIIVVDNSNGKEAAHSKELRSLINSVVKTPRMLNFPELHNFMADLAVTRKLEFYFWAHADNYVLPLTEGRDLGVDVLECMQKQISRAPNWGMLLFAYDHLAAFRTQTMVQVPWDPLVFQYGSECDVYGRIRDAGYDAKACKVHLSYDMKQDLNITDSMTYDQTKARLDADAKEKQGRNQWREGKMDEDEQDWRTAMKIASRAYLVSKWKVRGCKLRGLPCHKPWPYCPTCPAEIPDCFIKQPSRHELLQIHTAAKAAFASNPEQPIAYEEFKKNKILNSKQEDEGVVASI